jgi:hypothetical protein
MRLHIPGESTMKKSIILLTTCLSISLYLLLAGCTLQESKTNTVKTGQTTTGKSSSITTVTPSQYQFMPFVSSNGYTVDSQTTPDPNSIALNPTTTDMPGEPPTPTLFWPTPANNTFATPYARPAGARGQDLPPEKWQQWPVLPVISDRALDIYRAGVAQGNDPTHFSKVGDCQNIRQYFLGMFDTPGTFRLGDQYAYLQDTIDYFSSNWARLSEAVRTGFNVASVLAPLYANPENCQPVETPLACEIRIWNPSFAIISMETWTPERPVQVYENYLQQIVEYSISKNVLPILATKADNLEGDNAINQIIAKVAADYDIPLWNFWAATQPLTDQGLMEDRFHLTNGPNFFDSPESMDLGWPVRNLTGLLTIDTVWKAVR